jgi:hypothetical protein
MSKLDDLFAESEDLEDADLPEGVQGERRNHGRSVVFSIRLNPGELAELERYASGRELPARTLARAWILDRLREESADHDNGLAARVDRLERAVFPDDASRAS